MNLIAYLVQAIWFPMSRPDEVVQPGTDEWARGYVEHALFYDGAYQKFFVSTPWRERVSV